MSTKLIPTRLTCEYLINPMGITVPTPRLSWIVTSEERNQAQTAYQILVAGSREELDANRGTLWDSGCVISGQTTHIAYAGHPLISGQRCYWKVRVWDGYGDLTAYSEPASWQMGLLRAEDWQAQWIGLDPEPEPELGMHPAVYLRRAFTVKQPIARATLYATAKGVYIPSLNGQRIGNAELAPGWTDYKRRLQVQTYDVTTALQPGDNVLGITLGDGWYSGYLGFRGMHIMYGEYPRVLLQLVIEYNDGSTHTLVTDEQWRATANGPIRFGDIQMGERYDARLEFPGWDAPGFNDHVWNPVIVEPREAKVALVGQPDPPIRVTEEIVPVSVTEQTPGVFIFDLGQNIAGRVVLKVTGEAGTEIRLRFGEMLEPDDSLHTANLRSARATDDYICSGQGEEVYESHFTYHGFRYVEMTGYPGTPNLDTVTGHVMHNDMTYTGTFECSHPLINQLWRNIVWGQRGNFISIPTDCPQRDERLGWSGDAQIFCRTASFNMDVAAFFTKWLDDYADAQLPNGAFTDIAPNIGGLSAGAPAWGDAGIIIPWTLYRVYGDTRLIEKHWDAMVRWMNYIVEANPFYLRTRRLNNNYSDWVALEGGSSAEQIATAYWAKIARMMAEMAEAIGYMAEADAYTALFETIKQSYITAYVAPEGRIETNTQTAYVMALDNDLLPDALRTAAAEYLVHAIERRRGHLATGFLGTPPLCFVLAETDHLDVAYHLVNNETYPSWLYMIHNRATTMWERWNAYTREDGIHDPGMNSFNHYAYGAIAEWLYRVVAGIDAGEPGYKHILLRPRPGGGYTYAKAGYASIHGRIESGWQIETDGMGEDTCVRYVCTVPANTTATLELPTSNPYTIREGDGLATEAEGVDFVKYERGIAVFELGSGTYNFVVQ
ncbi:MAG: family 78 glycoside hydrolase catalytic domain [Anaerolineae bacterium]|nr:family 78 glycoside hydrolase catalytic domain [Anaerolineae bacterium]